MTEIKDRILTTHTGSLPRGEPLGSMLIDQEQGEPVGERELGAEIDKRVAHVLKKQAEVGIDIANDGEQGRVGFQTYLMQRMSGFGGVSKRPYGKEFLEFPQFTERMMQRIPKTGKVFDAPQAIDEIRYLGTTLLDAEIARLKRLPRRTVAIRRPFMNAPSPGIVAVHDAQRLLRLAGGLPRRDRARALYRVPDASSRRGSCCKLTRPISRWSACCSIRT